MTLLPGQIITTTITHLGGQGDGVGRIEQRPLYVPCTAPGDEVRVEIISVGRDFVRGALCDVLIHGTGRHEPACAHFAQCGGCSLQHLTPDAYREFKESMLRGVVQRLGYDLACLRPLVETGAHSRRRTELKITVQQGDVMIGFLAHRSHRLVAVEMCPVLEPELFALLTPLRDALQGLSKPGLLKAASLTLADNGPVIELQASGLLKAADTQRLIEFAKATGVRQLLLRVEEELESLYRDGEPEMMFGPYATILPPGAFLQASRLGQQALSEAVLRAFPAPVRLADIYSGCGTYSLPLVGAGHHVTAYEGSEAMVVALHNTAHRHKLDGKLEAYRRDLYRTPLTAKELARFTGAVINPPRNGALPQVKELATSQLKTIVMVSCNPATFERDAAMLRDAGWKLAEAIPIDQFVWSGHLELVATFRRS